MARLSGRLDKVEQAIRTEVDRLMGEAGAALLATMAPEHVAIVRAWFTPEVLADIRARPPETWGAYAARTKPPNLIRAMFELAGYHVLQDRPLSLPAEVAAVYVEDPDAQPRDGCDGCGYPAPVRCRATGTGPRKPTRHYFTHCPLCGARHAWVPADESRAGQGAADSRQAHATGADDEA